MIIIVVLPAPICKFISAASFIGKPVSLQERTKKDLQDLVGYKKWVQECKQVWGQEYLNRYPTHSKPDVESIYHSGDDWWLIHQNQKSKSSQLYLGVADGVGGWSDNGIDPAEVSQGLMYHTNQILEEHQKTRNGEEEEQELNQPRLLLSKAYQRVLNDQQILAGASTTLIARLDPVLAKLDWTNLGDSSLLIITDEGHKIGLRTNSQTHYFNCPYQLTKFPNHNSKHDNENFVTDTPEMADIGSINLKDGDLIFLFTDGLGDNLWSEEILLATKLIKNKNLKDFEFVQFLVHQLSTFARIASLQVNRVTPFEIEARKNGINDMKGGKVDDITLIVSLVRYNT